MADWRWIAVRLTGAQRAIVAALLALAAPFARAQPPGQIPRVGVHARRAGVTMDRSPRPGRLVTLLAVAVILVSGAACSTTWRDARIGTGFISYTLCAGVFVSKLDPAEVYTETIKPVLPSSVFDWIIRHHIDVAARQVRTTVAGLAEGRAIHRDGRAVWWFTGPSEQRPA